MKRMTFASALLATLMAAATAYAQTTPPATQTPPPATQTPPPAGQGAKPPALPAPPGTTTTPAKPLTPPPPFPPDSKFGFVNMQVIVSESKLGKQGSEQMNAFSAKINGDLQAKQKAVADLQKEIQSQSTVLQPSTLQAKQSQLESLTRQFQFDQNEAQAKIQELNQQLLDNFEQKVLPIIEAIAKEKNLYAVWSAGDNTGLAYAYAGLDLSQEVIKRLDAITPVK
jgi:outer membrane protein